MNTLDNAKLKRCRVELLKIFLKQRGRAVRALDLDLQFRGSEFKSR